jgi:Skp family chaperone for outer membrane proteins
MKKHSLQVLVPGVFAALALAVTVGAGAQTAPTAGPLSAGASAQAAPMPGHGKHTAAKTGPDADMKAECQAMMSRKQQMQDKVRANDAALDKLVADMNAAKRSREKERSMAAVLNELVAQRKASHSMMMEMQPEMMAHMMRHMEMHATKGAIECPMMKMVDGRSPSGGQP